MSGIADVIRQDAEGAPAAWWIEKSGSRRADEEEKKPPEGLGRLRMNFVTRLLPGLKAVVDGLLLAEIQA